MHRATPRTTSFRSYVSGGARTLIHAADDGPFMQEMEGSFMKGEKRKGVESPQNYGFTSVVSDADKDKDGNVTGSAEGFISFMGGNRSFPVCSVMDDRRHRLYGLEKGDTAMYRQRDDGQQFHMTKDGGFWGASTDKTVRMHLVDKQDGGQQQGGGQRAATGLATTGGAASGGQGGQQGQQKKGQKANYKDGQKSYRFVDVTKGATRMSGTESHMMLEDGDSYVHCVSKKTYLGAHASKAQFAKVITESGPAINVFGKIGGGGGLREASAPARAASHPALVPALMLVVGLSVGMNYRLLTAAAAPALPMLASACQMASLR